MFRIRILCRLAVILGFLKPEGVEDLLAAYRDVVATQPQTPFVQWAIRHGVLSKAQAQKIKQAYDVAQLRCTECGHSFCAGESDIAKPLVCTACGSEELALLENGQEKIGETLLEFSPPLSASAPSSGSGDTTSPFKMYERTKAHAAPGPAAKKPQSARSPSERSVSSAQREKAAHQGEDEQVSTSGEDTTSDDEEERTLPFPYDGPQDAHTGKRKADAPRRVVGRASEGESSLFEPPRGATEGDEPEIAEPADDDEEEESSVEVATEADEDDFLETAEHAETFAPPPPKKPSPRHVEQALPGTYRSDQQRNAEENEEPPAGTSGQPARVARPRPQSDRREAISQGTKIAGCRILKKVGQGGMGAVYKARHERLNKIVAVKILAPHLVENEIQVKRFIREGQSAARLEHPNIVTVHDVGEDNGHFYLIMQWVDGKSLQEILEEREVLPADNAVDYIIQAAQGLQAAHDEGIIHRDIKPDNLMLTPGGRIKVTDFGLAKGTKEDLRVSQTGMILGTPYYMSPEQGQSSSVDHRSDIYSLGITLYQLLTGKVPFTGNSAVQIIVKHIKEKIPPPRRLVPELSEDLEAIVLHMTAKDPAVRYQSMGALLTDLERVRPSLSHDAPDPRAVPEPSVFVSTPVEVTEEERTRVLRNLMAAKERDIETATRRRSNSGDRHTRLRKRSPATTVAGVFLALLLLAAGAAAAYYVVEGSPFDDDEVEELQGRALEPSPDPELVALQEGPEGDAPERDEDPHSEEPDTAEPGNGAPDNGEEPANGEANGDVDPEANGDVDPQETNASADPENGDDPENDNGVEPDEPDIGNGSEVVNGEDEKETPVPSIEDPHVEEAWQDFELLVQLFESDKTEYELYAEYRRRFRDLRVEYRRIPKLVAAIEAHLERMDDLLNTGAQHWWREHIPEYRDYRDRQRYHQALEVLDTLPAHFADTTVARDLARRREDVAPQARREREAQQAYERLDSVLEREASHTTLEDAERLFERFVANYRETRFAEEIPSLEARIKQMRSRLMRLLDAEQRERLERMLASLRSQVTTDLRDERYRSAMRRVEDVRDEFRDTELQPQLEEIEHNIRDEATQAWHAARERIEQEIAAGNYREVLRRIEEASDGALDEHKQEAEQMRTEFIESFVPEQLQAAEEARDAQAGLELVEEFSRVAEFQQIAPRMEWFRRRFELLEQGMVPVSVADDQVEAPDGNGSWQVEEFFISAHLVTRGEYREFIDAGGYESEEYWCEEGWQHVQDGAFRRVGVNQPRMDWRRGRPAAGTEDWPVASISYYEAKAYATWAGMELPSVREWQVAAGYDPTLNDGEGGFRRYPWGERFRTATGEVPARLNVEEDSRPRPGPVGTYAEDVSYYGVYDMAGNVAEWTRTAAEMPGRQWVVGGWFNAFADDAERIARVTQRRDIARLDRPTGVGFRLVTRVD